MRAPLLSVSRGRVLPRGCCSLVATACAMRDVPCQPDARQVRVVRGHQRAAAVRARVRTTCGLSAPRRSHSCQATLANLASQLLPAGVREPKLLGQVGARGDVPRAGAARRDPRHRCPCAAAHPSLPFQVVNEAPENNPPIKMEVRESAQGTRPEASERTVPWPARLAGGHRRLLAHRVRVQQVPVPFARRGARQDLLPARADKDQKHGGRHHSAREPGRRLICALSAGRGTGPAHVLSD